MFSATVKASTNIVCWCTIPSQASSALDGVEIDNLTVDRDFTTSWFKKAC